MSADRTFGKSLVVQWLGLCASTAGDTDSILGQGTKILGPTWYGQTHTHTQNKTSVVAESVEWGEKELDEGSQKVQTSCYKNNHGDIIENTVTVVKKEGESVSPSV